MTQIWKDIEYNGKVVEYVTEVGEDGWYLVLYDDGDMEHLEEWSF